MATTFQSKTVKMEPAEYERFAALAAARGRTPHYLMREALRQYLEREEAAEAFKRETRAAWQEYQETGLHLTGDEVCAWLDTWGTEAETEAPECHK